MKPQNARRRNLTYSSELFINLEINCIERTFVNSEIRKGIHKKTLSNISIGKLPVMLGSILCNLKRDINKKHLSFNEFIKSIKKNKNKKIGIIFGPEASGLSNEDIVNCNYIFKIPVNKKFESINLSHSLIIVCYEIFRSIKTSYFNKGKELNNIINKKKLNNLMHFVENRLEKKGFFQPPEKRKTMLINLRNIFGRTDLSYKELRILSSIFSKL